MTERADFSSIRPPHAVAAPSTSPRSSCEAQGGTLVEHGLVLIAAAVQPPEDALASHQDVVHVRAAVRARVVADQIREAMRDRWGAHALAMQQREHEVLDLARVGLTGALGAVLGVIAIARAAGVRMADAHVVLLFAMLDPAQALGVRRAGRFALVAVESVQRIEPVDNVLTDLRRQFLDLGGRQFAFVFGRHTFSFTRGRRARARRAREVRRTRIAQASSRSRAARRARHEGRESRHRQPRA
ncbi:hypothetical protein PSAC2689_200005 [Paraburkholderia sacchari]